MRQFCVTPAMGKRLIGQAMAKHPGVRKVLEKGTLAIMAGTTNGYVADEVLAGLGQGDGFSRQGFRRGMTVAPGAKVPQADFAGDVIIADGQWQKGKTIFDVVDDLRAGDVVLKGANAVDPGGHAAIQIGHRQGGTVLAAMTAIVGRRVRLILPVGLEKRALEDVNELAKRTNAPGAKGPRLYPTLGDVFTEIDAIRLLTGAEACLIASGGIYGAEGSLWLGVEGTEKKVAAAAKLIDSLAAEPACEA